MKSFLFILLALTVTNMAIASDPPPTSLTFRSSSSVRSEIPAKLYQAENPKALIIYIHGGSCSLPYHYPSLEFGGEDGLQLLPVLRERGYSVLFVEYAYQLSNSNYSRDRVRAQALSDLRLTPVDLCNYITQTELEDVKKVTEQLQEINPTHLPVFMLGHSYGGYLVNRIAVSDSRPSNVRGYISYAGLWDPRLPGIDGRVDNPGTQTSHDNAPIEGNLENVAPMLVIHSEDDPIVAINQFELISSRGIGQVQLLRMESGGHAATRRSENRRIARSIENFVQSLLPELRR